MAYQIETKNGEWRILNTVTDEIIVEFDSKQDVKQFLAYEKIYEGKKRAIEILMTFPNHWIVNDKYQRAESGIEDYTKWILSINHYDTYTDYYKAIDEKLDELLNKVVDVE